MMPAFFVGGGCHIPRKYGISARINQELESGEVIIPL